MTTKVITVVILDLEVIMSDVEFSPDALTSILSAEKSRNQDAPVKVGNIIIGETKDVRQEGTKLIADLHLNMDLLNNKAIEDSKALFVQSLGFTIND